MRTHASRALAALALALGATSSTVAAAHAAVITDCTRAAVASAVTAGGSHTFACDGRIVRNSQLVVATTVSFGR